VIYFKSNFTQPGDFTANIGPFWIANTNLNNLEKGILFGWSQRVLIDIFPV